MLRSLLGNQENVWLKRTNLFVDSRLLKCTCFRTNKCFGLFLRINENKSSDTYLAAVKFSQ